MNPLFNDQQARERALDTSNSFIVQAPAGSGKTELLTQRFLALLSCVKQPEEILAITFTKKSAAEMRSRIISALQKAAQSSEPKEPHTKKTWDLAKNALEQNTRLKWNLLQNPNRLSIQTIDSFNAYLTRLLPLLSHFGAAPEITDEPEILYNEAVTEFLSHLENDLPWSNAIAQLLLHLDNDLEKTSNLLINMLKKRDQWLPYITFNASDPLLRQTLETPLAKIVQDNLNELNTALPQEYKKELVFLARFAAENLQREHSDSKIINCADLSEEKIFNKDQWLGLVELFLTKSYTWRKEFKKSEGFPSAAESRNKKEKEYFSEIKKRIENLIESLSQNEKLTLALQDLRFSPNSQYNKNQWDILNALHQVLKVVTAQLRITFQKHRKMDYIENTQAALMALGSEDNPTDLALMLDYKIQHILVDEFQDTSTNQYRLLEKLTAGWISEDGRTLFVVGDPMQSIYRFREANVGLFIRSCVQGIGSVFLESLKLSVNFRSTSNIVKWINTVFEKIFPIADNITTGAISYTPSLAHHTVPIETKSVELHALPHKDDKVQAVDIIELIQKIKQEDPREKIAIIVRARAHLEWIVPALKKANLSYRAIDIDSLDTRSITRDLSALTQALLHPADRLSWLTVLRSPWCGLSLHDLLLLSGNDSKLTLWQRLQASDAIQQLSAEGQLRINRILPILQNNMSLRCRMTLRQWVEVTWLALGGPACATQENELEDANTFFNLLEELDKGGNLPYLTELEKNLKELYALPDNKADDSLQIMTIHNAKGLEFDTVILPYLEKRTRPNQKELLLWMENLSPNKLNELIMAPLHSAEEDSDPIYDYIKHQHAIKEEHEMARLLYVAATRAKKNLHLFFNPEKNKQGLLEKLWPAIESEVAQPISVVEPIKELSSMPQQRFIRRFSAAWKNPLIFQNLTAITPHQKNEGFILRDDKAKHIGTVTHRILQYLCQKGEKIWKSKSEKQKKYHIEYHLSQLGMVNNMVSAIEAVLTAIENTLKDPHGQWIIKAHAESKTEFCLTAILEGKIVSLVIDRTFVDETNTRWIIDYKTAMVKNKNLDQFFEEEEKKYSTQLKRYSLAMSQIDSRVIKLGLYFPLIPAWREIAKE